MLLVKNGRIVNSRIHIQAEKTPFRGQRGSMISLLPVVYIFPYPNSTLNS